MLAVTAAVLLRLGLERLAMCTASFAATAGGLGEAEVDRGASFHFTLGSQT